jgi:bifunctional non-homologous end joining protein LigD
VPLAFIPPLLPTLVDEPPPGGAWSLEIKFDGYRTQILIDASRARLFTRNGHDWTAKYRTLASAAEGFSLDEAIIDGEVIINDTEGKPDFGLLRNAIRSREQELVFMAFDLLHLRGHDRRRMPLEERRHILEDLVEPAHEPIRFSEALQGDGKAIYEAVDRMGT